MKQTRLFDSKVLAVALVAGSTLAACGNEGGSLVPTGTATPAGTAAPRKQLGTHQPYATLGMNTDKRDPAGRPVRIACSVCHHDAVKPNQANGDKKQLADFHQGVRLDHGTHSSCLTCHAPPRYDRFRLANGKTVAYGNVVELCAQCHSAQWRDYQQGAHGGMTGYWDEERGARDRNHCLDCHNPHSPAAKQMRPARRPNVRFQVKKVPDHG